jgi:quercetin dioxygenase-like cupin family protein
MPEPRVLRFAEQDWEDDVPGIRDRPQQVDGTRWALVEYAPGAAREAWCTDGHRGFVVAGEIEYEFDDGSQPLRAGAGDAFLLPGGSGHRGRNRADGPTRLFLIDDPPGA